MIPTKPAVFIYTALPCEAKPLIEHFKLKKDSSKHVFAVYFSNNMYLTVTGLGKNAMAAGVAYTQALFSSAGQPVMLNVGVAGHKDYALGEIYLVDKNIDLDSRKNYYPPILFKSPCPTACLQTATQAQLDYKQATLYDMEGSAFYETALRFTTGELSQSLKIISDNQFSPATNLRPQQASDLIAANMTIIETVVLELHSIASTLNYQEVKSYHEVLKQYHFTSTEQIQLKSLLSRWAVISSEPVPEFTETHNQRGKALLRWLEQQIDQLDFYL